MLLSSQSAAPAVILISMTVDYCVSRGGRENRSLLSHHLEPELQVIYLYESFLPHKRPRRGQAEQTGVSGVLGQGAASVALGLLPCQLASIFRCLPWKLDLN